MRIEVFLEIITALVVLISGTPFETPSHVIHERRSVAAPEWTQDSRLHPSTVLPVRIGLVQQNLHLAEHFINEVSHPDSKSYGRHWTPDQVAKAFAPSQNTVQAVVKWLRVSGIDPDRLRLSKTGSWITFNTTASEAEDLLRTHYHLYTHQTGSQQIACEHYSVPRHLSEHIDLIYPTVHFDKILYSQRGKEESGDPEAASQELQRRQLMGGPGDPSNPKSGVVVNNALMTLEDCDVMITPRCLQALYNIPDGTLAGKDNTLGVVEYTPQAFLQDDLNAWFQQFQPRIVNKTPIVNLIDGAIVQTALQNTSFNGESSLDLQFAMALINPQQVTLFQVGDIVHGGTFNNFLDALDGSYCTTGGGDDKNVDSIYPDTDKGGSDGPEDCGTVATTKIISTSYSMNEADVSPAYIQRQCMEYMKLGLQGITILYSSGDHGVAGQTGACLNSNGSLNDNGSGKFVPSFPGTCPYVTTVGATQIQNGSSVRDVETACQTVISSGGGFSDVFALPSYQSSAVSKYFADHTPPYSSNVYNNSQRVRGYPDVAANGANYVVAIDGKFTMEYGTSASTPTFASVLNLINEQRTKAGKSSLGFVNPVLYEHPEILNDITQGGNPGCGTPGFQSVPGWDPVTGLGTPNYTKMLSLFMSLP